MNKSGIYQIKNLVTSKVYVGSSKNLNIRRSQHFRKLRKDIHINCKLQNSWKKHGEENFVFEILEICGEVDLLIREQFFIDSLDSVLNGYNLAPITGRSTLGFKHSEESRAKMSKAKTGTKLPRTSEHQAKLTASQVGRTVTQETRDKIAKSLKGRKTPEETIAKLKIIRTGKKLAPPTDEARLNRSLAQKRRFERVRNEAAMNGLQ